MTTRPSRKPTPANGPDINALLSGARLPETIVDVCLRADLVAEHEAAEDALQAALNGPQKFSGNGAAEHRDEILALEAEMKASTVRFRFRGLPKPKWRKLIAEHPPRLNPDGSLMQGDAPGINSDTFYGAMLRACTVEPVLTEEQWRVLVGDTEEAAAKLEAEGRADEIEDGKLTDRQWDSITDAAWKINRGEVQVPFSRAASRLSASSETE